jgi:type II secretory ATPase GspE/PulE/Tfp pilus assembly ATPase PilB-like protein
MASSSGILDAASMQDILTEIGVKPSHVKIALQREEATGEALSQIMRDFGFLSGEQVADAVSRQTGFAYFPNTGLDHIQVEHLKNIALNEYRRFVPVGRDPDGALVIAVPDDRVINDAKNEFYNYNTRIVIASEATIQTVYRRHFAHTEAAFDNAVVAFMKALRNSKSEEDAGLLRDVFGALLRHSCYSGASDLYLYKSEFVGLVKLKINGVGQIFRSIDGELFDRLLTKLVTENTKVEDLRREPKESIIEFSDEDKKRYEDITSRFGFRLELTESRGVRNAVVRMLDKQSSATELSKLGLDAHTLSALKRMSQSSTGLIIVTGPTGSGKTTTLYSMLKAIDPVERSIQSIENPVEYRHGLWQQYELRKDSTNEGEEFQKWLKALLRNAPDVILLGEIRDSEVAQILLDAANTGHLAFTTLHTNNAALALARLKRFKVDQATLASVLLGILGQRLLRMLCKDCKVPDTSPETQEDLDKPYVMTHKTPHKPGDGCANCDYTGYRGRRMIYELLEVNQEVKHLIEEGATPTQVAAKGIKAGASMWAHGLKLVAEGVTSMDELIRVAVRD